MSRIGKKPITLPSGVTVTVSGQTVSVKGPKGELAFALPEGVMLAQENGVATISLKENSGSFAVWGLARAMVQNMITGVTAGFTKSLELNGVGFKVVLLGKKLVLNVGFSHPVEYPLPDGITAVVEKNVITLSGIDRQLVGQVAAEIRSIKKPEPYKGKGIKYSDEVIRRKEGKVMKSAAA